MRFGNGSHEIYFSLWTLPYDHTTELLPSHTVNLSTAIIQCRKIHFELLWQRRAWATRVTKLMPQIDGGKTNNQQQKREISRENDDLRKQEPQLDAYVRNIVWDKDGKCAWSVDAFEHWTWTLLDRRASNWIAWWLYMCDVALTRVSLCLYLENMEFFFLRITRIAATMAIFVQHTPDACSLCMWYANVFPSM